jgi:hypothetical protein
MSFGLKTLLFHSKDVADGNPLTLTVFVLH